MLPKFSRTGTPLGRDNLVVSEHSFTIFCFVFWIFGIYLIPIYLVSERVMIPAFGVLEIYRIPVVGILDIWVSQVCESNWALSDFRYGYVSDFRFGFIWISGDMYVRNFEVKLGTGQRRNISRQQIGMLLFYVCYIGIDICNLI